MNNRTETTSLESEKRGVSHNLVAALGGVTSVACSEIKQQTSSGASEAISTNKEELKETPNTVLQLTELNETQVVIGSAYQARNFNQQSDTRYRFGPDENNRLGIQEGSVFDSQLNGPITRLSIDGTIPAFGVFPYADSHEMVLFENGVSYRLNPNTVQDGDQLNHQPFPVLPIGAEPAGAYDGHIILYNTRADLSNTSVLYSVRVEDAMDQDATRVIYEFDSPIDSAGQLGQNSFRVKLEDNNQYYVVADSDGENGINLTAIPILDALESQMLRVDGMNLPTFLNLEKFNAVGLHQGPSRAVNGGHFRKVYVSDDITPEIIPDEDAGVPDQGVNPIPDAGQEPDAETPDMGVEEDFELPEQDAETPQEDAGQEIDMIQMPNPDMAQLPDGHTVNISPQIKGGDGSTVKPTPETPEETYTYTTNGSGCGSEVAPVNGKGEIQFKVPSTSTSSEQPVHEEGCNTVPDAGLATPSLVLALVVSRVLRAIRPRKNK